MQYMEYGNDRDETIILLHGGGLSWWSFREAAEILQTRYHVILPVLDGHAGSDRPFTSIEDNAAGIISLIRKHLGGRVLLTGGLSLGGQILLEMLSQCSGISRYAVVESAAVIPSGVTHVLIGPVFGCSYGLIRHRAFAKCQFASLHLKQDLFEEYYRDTCRIAKDDMIAFLRASTAYSIKPALSMTECSRKLSD